MLRVYTCLAQEHDIRLVLVAAAICLLSSVTAFTLAGHARKVDGPLRWLWLVALAFVTGTGIWATHFIAMLAYQPGLPTGYSASLTLLSIVVAIVTSGIGWKVSWSRHPISLPTAGTLMLAGIGLMHFTGMAALRTMGQLEYDTAPIAVSALIAWGAATSALRLCRRKGRVWYYVAAALFALAICTLHFGSMSAVTIRPDPNIVIESGTIDASSLAIVIASLVFALLGCAFVTTELEGRFVRNAALEGQRLKQFAESAMEGLAILAGDRIVDANGIFWLTAGYDPNNPPRDLNISSVLPEHRSRLTNPDGQSFLESELVRGDGKRVEVETTARFSQIRGLARELVIVRDISERKAAAARVEHLASHDPLTGVGNRSSLGRALDEALAHSTPEMPAAMLCLDLDRFKTINDLYGHPMGDAVLVEIARRVSHCLIPGETLARLGGDEFAIVQPPKVQPQHAGRLAERILEAMSDEMAIGPLTINVNASIGIALHPQNAQTADELHKKADLALYRAKADGRGVYRFFDGTMDEELAGRHRMEADLKKALTDGQFHLHYQPIACLETGRIIGFEALLRWRHPIFGEISPVDFVPVAEENGLIVPIGEWVLESACREALRWKQPLMVAVNLSPVQFAFGDVAATVEQVLQRTGIASSRLDLEITEGLLIKDTDKALATLTRLKGLGVRIAMDDFGTGYSSLSYFRMFPFDKVKIDRSFVNEMASNPQALAVVKAVIGLSRGLGMSVLAEGVETLEQLTMLQIEGCQQVQGFAIGAPAPIEQFDRVVVNRMTIGQPDFNEGGNRLQSNGSYSDLFGNPKRRAAGS